MKAAVVTCSNRSAAGERADDSGELLVTALCDAGHEVVLRRIVPDVVDDIRAAVRAGLDAGARVVVTTGGTGLAPTDVTPEAIAPMLDRPVPGIAEAIRAAGGAALPAAMLSRGVSGTIGQALVVTLPGSPGGVRNGVAVLLPVLEHAIDQLSGGDHRSGGGV